jgi:hypothetical protein
MAFTKIKLRRGTAAEWADANPILADGEPGLALDTKVFKVGDGVTAWNDLVVIGPSASSSGGSGSRGDDALLAAGLLTENTELMNCSTQSALTAGTIYGMLVGLKEGDVVSKLVVCVGSGVAAAGTPPTMIKMGLVSSAGVVLALTANEASNPAWPTAGPLPLSLLTPYEVTDTGGYRVVILQVGSWSSSQAQLVKGSVVGVNQAAPVPGALRRWASHGTGQTDLPAVGASLPSAVGSNVNVPLWAGVA